MSRVYAPLRRALLMAAMFLLPSAVAAQTDYYNTDKGRPLRTEDAYPVERRAFELQAAPLRIARGAQGAYRWTIEPEIALGILPRTHIEVGIPFSIVDAGGTASSGVDALHFSVLHNLNAETTTVPALAIGVSAALPTGRDAGAGAQLTVKGIATRTLTWARVHVNGEYSPGGEQMDDAHPDERWAASLAVDHTFPLRSLLIGAEVVTSQLARDDAEADYAVAAGLRYQLSPRWVMDAGIGRQWTGERSWSATFGAAYAFGLFWRERVRP
jgi:hypothetical protein